MNWKKLKNELEQAEKRAGDEDTVTSGLNSPEFTALLQFGAPLRLGAEPVAAGQARQYLARGRCSK